MKLLSTNDWLARHPKIIGVLIVLLYLFACFLETT
jgi:hypothetical protein